VRRARRISHRLINACQSCQTHQYDYGGGTNGQEANEKDQEKDQDTKIQEEIRKMPPSSSPVTSTES
jgi:hypothetical protein